MSTKTTFKRVALVAVAALGLSLVAVAPSSADSGQWNISATTAPATGTIGTTVTGNFSINWAASAAGDLTTSGAAIWSEPSTSSLTNASLTWSDGASASLTNTNITTGDLNGAAGSNTIWYYGNFGGATGFTSFAGYTNAVQFKSTAAGRSVANAKLSFTPDVAGTYVIRVFAAPGATTSALFTEWTVTVAAKTPITAATSKLTPSDTALFAPKAIGSPAGSLLVEAKNAENNASSATTSASVSGPGLVSFTNDYTAAGRAISSSGNTKTLYFFADGTSGVSTITVSSGSTVLGTQTVTYYGSVASLTTTVKKPVSNAGGIATTAVLAVVAKDAAGVVVPSQAVTITSGTTATIASFSGTSSSISEASAGTATIGVTGIADTFGTVTLTIKDTATGLVSTTANVIVSSPVAAAVTMAFDKTDYLPGEKAILTIKATDANGLPVANQLANSGEEFSWVANLATTSSLPEAATFSNGSMSVTLFAAGYTGAFSVAAKLVAGDAWATALDDTTLTATANIVTDGVAQAAADSAAEATDAANAATDAANAAAEAADAATAAAQDAADAVAALSTQVAEMIDALKKQITALTNLVIKIQKKVKA